MRKAILATTILAAATLTATPAMPLDLGDAIGDGVSGALGAGRSALGAGKSALGTVIDTVKPQPDIAPEPATVALDPTKMIGLSVRTSDGKMVGSVAGVPVGASGEPLAIIATVTDPASPAGTRVQVPIGRTAIVGNEIRIQATEAELRSFISMNAAATVPPSTNAGGTLGAGATISTAPIAADATLSGTASGLAGATLPSTSATVAATSAADSAFIASIESALQSAAADTGVEATPQRGDWAIGPVAVNTGETRLVNNTFVRDLNVLQDVRPAALDPDAGRRLPDASGGSSAAAPADAGEIAAPARQSMAAAEAVPARPESEDLRTVGSEPAAQPLLRPVGEEPDTAKPEVLTASVPTGLPWEWFAIGAALAAVLGLMSTRWRSIFASEPDVVRRASEPPLHTSS